mmetsp:Transcript_13067/g.38957  ORF Transcript_13067/g.38957 Transcript_13067/m.38957 type:complete len:218 (+) Transcript_13067:656-1309(+)
MAATLASAWRHATICSRNSASQRACAAARSRRQASKRASASARCRMHSASCCIKLPCSRTNIEAPSCARRKAAPWSWAFECLSCLKAATALSARWRASTSQRNSCSHVSCVVTQRCRRSANWASAPCNCLTRCSHKPSRSSSKAAARPSARRNAATSLRNSPDRQLSAEAHWLSQARISASACASFSSNALWCKSDWASNMATLSSARRLWRHSASN